MLFLKGDDAKALRQRALQDPLAANLAQAVVGQAQAILSEPVIERRFEAGRPVMLPTSRLMADRAFVLGIAFFLTGGQIYRRRLIDEMLAVSAFPDWNMTHFIDAAEMLAAVAIGRDWCAPLLTTGEKRVIDTAMVEFAMKPGLYSLIDSPKWPRIRTNWNIVCSASLIIGALVVDDTHQEISTDVLERACAAIQIGLAAYGRDGGWPEGAGYWEYATRFAVLAFAALESRGCTLLKIENFPALLDTWRFGRALTAPSGLVFDSGDSLALGRRLPVYGWLANRSADAGAADWQWRAPGDRHPLDLLWFAPAPIGIAEARSDVEVFRDAGYAVVAGEGGTYLAVRGGSNRTNHAHLDLGTFILECDGVRFASDLGREDYAVPGYFKAETRFTHFRTRTRAHNTIGFAGRDQSLDARADFVECEGERQIACHIRDPDAPYEHFRAFKVLNDRSVIVIDRLRPAKEMTTPVEIMWNLYTQAVVRAGEASLELTIGDKTMYLAIQQPEKASLTVETVSELGSGAHAFNRISLRLEASRDVTIAAIFSGTPAHDGTAEIDGLDRWLEEVMQPALV
nr:heparinase II/III family protein [uncultured Shinella sp.]